MLCAACPKVTIFPGVVFICLTLKCPSFATGVFSIEMFRRVAQAFDLAAALSDVAKGLKKKMEDITWAAAIGEIRAAHSITRIHTQTIMSALRLPFHHVVLPVYHLHRLPIAIPPHRIACKRCWLVLGLWHPKAPILIHRLFYNVEGFSFFVGGTMLHIRLLFFKSVIVPRDWTEKNLAAFLPRWSRALPRLACLYIPAAFLVLFIPMTARYSMPKYRKINVKFDAS